jgi:hypothetical protein
MERYFLFSCFFDDAPWYVYHAGAETRRLRMGISLARHSWCLPRLDAGVDPSPVASREDHKSAPALVANFVSTINPNSLFVLDHSGFMAAQRGALPKRNRFLYSSFSLYQREAGFSIVSSHSGSVSSLNLCEYLSTHFVTRGSRIMSSDCA